MRWIVSCAAATLLASAVIVSGGGVNRAAKDRNEPGPNANGEGTAEPIAGELIVHEWGTFTSFSGSDGVRLEFRPLIDEDLPPFVFDRFLQSGVSNPFLKSRVRARMRMETPVTYFYTERERDVNVHVEFPNGLLTEFYPPVAHMAPDFKLFERIPITNSMLDWDRIHLIPTDRLQADVNDPQLRRLLEKRMIAGLVPPDNNSHNHYYHARETDSALVQVHRGPPADPKKRPFAPTGDFFEKFLFYRGIGNFDLPLQLKARGEGRYELLNAGPDPIRSLLLVTVDGSDVRFTELAEIQSGGRLPLKQSLKPSTVDQLGETVAAALVREGLYNKEAWAMVNTWKSSWFGENGTRLLYMLPQRITDEILPLKIEPSPDETVRVLVGRMEILSPEDETRIVELIRKSAAERQAAYRTSKSAGKPPSYRWPPELAQWGRLAEPALARARAISDDPVVRSESTLLLLDLEADR
jgi:hypothetical protein